jgi:hypothetical protein
VQITDLFLTYQLHKYYRNRGDIAYTPAELESSLLLDTKLEGAAALARTGFMSLVEDPIRVGIPFRVNSGVPGCIIALPSDSRLLGTEC